MKPSFNSICCDTGQLIDRYINSSHDRPPIQYNRNHGQPVTHPNKTCTVEWQLTHSCTRANPVSHLILHSTSHRANVRNQPSVSNQSLINTSQPNYSQSQISTYAVDDLTINYVHQAYQSANEPVGKSVSSSVSRAAMSCTTQASQSHMQAYEY